MATAVGFRTQRLAGAVEDRFATAETLPRVPTVKVLSRIRLVARMLEDEPGLTSRELAERTGLPRREMSLLLLRLEEHGHVVHEGRRWFAGHESVV